MSQEQETPVNSNDPQQPIIVQQAVYQFAMLPMPTVANRFLEAPPGFRLHSIHPISSAIAGAHAPRGLLAVLEGFRTAAVVPDAPANPPASQ